MVALPLVLKACEDLQIPFDMETADERALQGHDVIDLVSYARLLRQADGLCVEVLDRLTIGPFRRRVELGCVALHDESSDLRMISLSPALVVVSMLLVVLRAPFRSILRALRSMICGPFCKRARVFQSPFSEILQSSASSWSGLFLRARSAARFAAWIELFARLSRFAGPTKASQHERIRQPLLAFNDSRVIESALGLVGHFAVSIWRSMMRRTSSAMEMPRRFASLIRNFLCGSVNEIICLVMSFPWIVRVGAALDLDAHLGLSLDDGFEVFSRNDLFDKDEAVCIRQGAARLAGALCGFELLVRKTKAWIGHAPSIPLGIPCST